MAVGVREMLRACGASVRRAVCFGDQGLGDGEVHPLAADRQHGAGECAGAGAEFRCRICWFVRAPGAGSVRFPFQGTLGRGRECRGDPAGLDPGPPLTREAPDQIRGG